MRSSCLRRLNIRSPIFFFQTKLRDNPNTCVRANHLLRGKLILLSYLCTIVSTKEVLFAHGWHVSFLVENFKSWSVFRLSLNHRNCWFVAQDLCNRPFLDLLNWLKFLHPRFLLQLLNFLSPIKEKKLLSCFWRIQIHFTHTESNLALAGGQIRPQTSTHLLSRESANFPDQLDGWRHILSSAVDN